MLIRPPGYYWLLVDGEEPEVVLFTKWDGGLTFNRFLDGDESWILRSDAVRDWAAWSEA